MEFPESLPSILQYQMSSGVTLYALPRRPVETVSSSGKTTASYVNPVVPHGAVAWRLVAEDEWHPLSELPEAWLPFLQRERGTVHDPRPKHKEKHKPVAKDVILDSPDD